jgi:hypothetical protein
MPGPAGTLGMDASFDIFQQPSFSSFPTSFASPKTLFLNERDVAIHFRLLLLGLYGNYEPALF